MIDYQVPKDVLDALAVLENDTIDKPSEPFYTPKELGKLSKKNLVIHAYKIQLEKHELQGILKEFLEVYTQLWSTPN